METLERGFAHNLREFVEAARAVAPALGAASVPCAGGTAAFLGDDSPLTTTKGAGPTLTSRDVDSVEAFFRARGVRRAVFELAPWQSTAATALLVQRGYAIVDSEDVVTQAPP